MLDCGESVALGLPTTYTKCKWSGPEEIDDAQAAGGGPMSLREMQVAV
jgi:hypothetical protein